jgi:peptidoglycan hydrolase-like protein with peptidoglycan-binding domain
VPEGKYLAVAGQALESARRVADAQRLLTRLRLYDGRADGKLDDITSDAVSLFQYRRGEIVTGEVDVDLLNQLRKAVEDRIATPPSKIRPGRVGPPTEDEYRKVAARLRLDGATLMAVRRVEATEGFTADGRMRILFEANVFSRLTDHRYDDTHPHISSRLWSRELYPKTRDGVWAQLQDAFVLDPVAAYSSATYGAYQLLGTHYKAAGFETPAEFALFMSESEANQLEVFVRWLGSERVDSVDRLRAHDWESFARAYNGPGYAASGYHVKLANAYAAALSSLAQTSSTPAQQPE